MFVGYVGLVGLMSLGGNLSIPTSSDFTIWDIIVHCVADVMNYNCHPIEIPFWQ